MSLTKEELEQLNSNESEFADFIGKVKNRISNITPGEPESSSIKAFSPAHFSRLTNPFTLQRPAPSASSSLFNSSEPDSSADLASPSLGSLSSREPLESSRDHPNLFKSWLSRGSFLPDADPSMVISSQLVRRRDTNSSLYRPFPSENVPRKASLFQFDSSESDSNDDIVSDNSLLPRGSDNSRSYSQHNDDSADELVSEDDNSIDLVPLLPHKSSQIKTDTPKPVSHEYFSNRPTSLSRKPVSSPNSFGALLNLRLNRGSNSSYLNQKEPISQNGDISDDEDTNDTFALDAGLNAKAKVTPKSSEER